MSQTQLVTSTASPRYRVVVRSAIATSSGGGKCRYPVHIRVMDTTQSEWHAVRSLNDGVRAEWLNMDSRYKGERSAYGQAMAAALTLCRELNQRNTEITPIANPKGV